MPIFARVVKKPLIWKHPQTCNKTLCRAELSRGGGEWSVVIGWRFCEKRSLKDWGRMGRGMGLKVGECVGWVLRSIMWKFGQLLRSGLGDISRGRLGGFPSSSRFGELCIVWFALTAQELLREGLFLNLRKWVSMVFINNLPKFGAFLRSGSGRTWIWEGWSRFRLVGFERLSHATLCFAQTLHYWFRRMSIKYEEIQRRYMREFGKMSS